ncbi:hypothetical protein [Saccharothrix texasensis]|uniref:hypothetical protein n=1 Tax=Saccharothrix texasensis TaxID=103734 RepID=UPI0011CE36F2|nr:hypothetical protein [Saccharothrix texasensis]
MAARNLIADPFRPSGMWRRTWPLGVLLLATACGAIDAGGTACTAIGTRTGVSVDVEHPGVVSGTIEVCWDDFCATPGLELYPSSRVVGTTCTGASPDDSCSARSEPTEGKHGFADLPQLPVKPVTATLKLLDQSGSALVDRNIALTPEMVYPNGPDCPAGGPQAGISVGADGSITER